LIDESRASKAAAIVANLKTIYQNKIAIYILLRSPADGKFLLTGTQLPL
jgi:hypothetical protein